MCLLLILSNKLDLNQETRFTIATLVLLMATAKKETLKDILPQTFSQQTSCLRA